VFVRVLFRAFVHAFVRAFVRLYVTASQYNPKQRRTAFVRESNFSFLFVPYDDGFYLNYLRTYLFRDAYPRWHKTIFAHALL